MAAVGTGPFPFPPVHPPCTVWHGWMSINSHIEHTPKKAASAGISSLALNCMSTKLEMDDSLLLSNPATYPRKALSWIVTHQTW